jgi:molybdenum cofactor synthesis domain-containing protein
LSDFVQKHGIEVRSSAVVADDVQQIARKLTEWADGGDFDLILTTGGTGVAPRDVTPEATQSILDRTIPGMAEAMRAASLKKTPHAMISRAVAGIRNRALIINLPGSPKGAVENLEAVLPALEHAVAKIQGDPSDCV